MVNDFQVGFAFSQAAETKGFAKPKIPFRVFRRTAF